WLRTLQSLPFPRLARSSPAKRLVFGVEAQSRCFRTRPSITSQVSRLSDQLVAFGYPELNESAVRNLHAAPNRISRRQGSNLFRLTHQLHQELEEWLIDSVVAVLIGTPA